MLSIGVPHDIGNAINFLTEVIADWEQRREDYSDLSHTFILVVLNVVL